MRRITVIFIFYLSMLGMFSCEYFSFERNKNIQDLDTILDRSTVDVFPSFSACDSIIDKEEKTSCFRQTIHEEITNRLGRQEIKVKRSIEETIEVVLTVHSDHRITLKSVKASDSLVEMIPDLKERIDKSIQQLPKVHAAIKRGIPVTSEYKLPILIKLKD